MGIETPEASTTASNLPLERMLSALLRYGVWLASLVIGAGLILALVRSEGMQVANAGIALLILLPVSRLVLMLVVFLRDRDYRLALATALVLSSIVAGVVVAIRTTSVLGG